MIVRGLMILGICFLTGSCSDSLIKKEVSGKPLSPVIPKQVNWIGHWKNEGYKERLLFDVKRRFEFENQHISLNIVFPEELYSTTKNDIQFISEEVLKSQTEWDIMRINNNPNATGILAEDKKWTSKYLVDFSQYDQFRKNSVDHLFSDEMKARWGGIIPGHALDANNFVLWCNKVAAAKIGINPKPFEMNTDDLDSYLNALSIYNQKNSSKIYAFNINEGWNPGYRMVFQLYASLIGDYTKLKDETYSEDKIAAWEKVLIFLEKIASYGVINPEWNKYSWNSYYDKFLKSDYLFFVEATWLYNILENTDSINFKNVVPLELPGFQTNKTYLGEISIPWVVPKNAKNREEAIQFMLYWCDSEIADDWIKNTKGPTGIKNSMVQSEFGKDVYEKYDYTINKKYTGKMVTASPDNNARIFGLKNKSVPNYFLEVITGSMSANSAMQKIKYSLIKK